MKPKPNGRKWYSEVYLTSQHWTETRASALKASGGCCQECDETYGLQVHHISYDRIWHEEPEDLIVLCPNCHGKEHGKTWDGKPIRIHNKYGHDVVLSISQRIGKSHRMSHHSRGLLVYMLSNRIKKTFPRTVENLASFNELKSLGYVEESIEDGKTIWTWDDGLP